jgi:hypothetical protein
MCVVSQETPAASPDTGSAKIQASRTIPTTNIPDEPKPVGAITFGYIYLASETAPGGQWDWHLHGFYGIPQYNIKPWIAVFADFTQSYDTSKGSHHNRQSKLGGLLFTKTTRTRISPFGFIDGGYVRDSAVGKVTESPALGVGGGALLKVNRRVSVFLVPGEYIRTYAPNGGLNNFTSRIGITLPLYR